MKQKSKFDAVLLGAGERKIAVIKAIKEVTGLGAPEAKALAENLPSLIKADLTTAEADAICEKFAAIGDDVNLEAQPCKSGAKQPDSEDTRGIPLEALHAVSDIADSLKACMVVLLEANHKPWNDVRNMLTPIVDRLCEITDEHFPD